MTLYCKETADDYSFCKGSLKKIKLAVLELDAMGYVKILGC